MNFFRHNKLKDLPRRRADNAKILSSRINPSQLRPIKEAKWITASIYNRSYSLSASRARANLTNVKYYPSPQASRLRLEFNREEDTSKILLFRTLPLQIE